jgi:hypothetical protein
LDAERSAAAFQGDVKEISVRDIVASASRLDRTGLRLRGTIDVVVRAYALTGTIIAIAGISYIFLTRSVSVESNPGIALIASLAGVFISLVAMFFYMRRGRGLAGAREVVYSRPYEPTEEWGVGFITKWSEAELSIRKLAANYLGESRAKGPIGSLINDLSEARILRQEDLTALKNALELRNKIVHSGARLSRNEYETALRNLARFLDER